MNTFSTRKTGFGAGGVLLKMSEESKFQHLDEWLGTIVEDYNTHLSMLNEACEKADVPEMPLFERIDAIDITQRIWCYYARQAGVVISKIEGYIFEWEPLGSQASDLVEAAEEKMELVMAERSGLALKIAELSELRAELTHQYLRQEGIIEGGE